MVALANDERVACVACKRLPGAGAASVLSRCGCCGGPGRPSLAHLSRFEREMPSGRWSYVVPLSISWPSLSALHDVASASVAVLEEMGYLIGRVPRDVPEQGRAPRPAFDERYAVSHPRASGVSASMRIVSLTDVLLQVNVLVARDLVLSVALNVHAYWSSSSPSSAPSVRLRNIPTLAVHLKERIGWPLLWRMCALDGTEPPLPFDAILGCPELMVRPFALCCENVGFLFSLFCISSLPSIPPLSFRRTLLMMSARSSTSCSFSTVTAGRACHASRSESEPPFSRA